MSFLFFNFHHRPTGPVCIVVVISHTNKKKMFIYLYSAVCVCVCLRFTHVSIVEQWWRARAAATNTAIYSDRTRTYTYKWLLLLASSIIIITTLLLDVDMCVCVSKVCCNSVVNGFIYILIYTILDVRVYASCSILRLSFYVFYALTLAVCVLVCTHRASLFRFFLFNQLKYIPKHVSFY